MDFTQTTVIAPVWKDGVTLMKQNYYQVERKILKHIYVPMQWDIYITYSRYGQMYWVPWELQLQSMKIDHIINLVQCNTVLHHYKLQRHQ